MLGKKDVIKKTSFKFSDLNFRMFFKNVIFIILIILTLLLIIFVFSSINLTKRICNDGTFYNNCSEIKPFYCDDGNLIERASICGCNNVATQRIDSCITPYKNQPKNITLKYFLRGDESEINYTVYGGLMEYLSTFPKTIFYEEGEIPLIEEFKIKTIYEEQQRELILPLIFKIKEVTNNKEDQLRIAVSIVQKIPFGFSNKTFNIGFDFNTSYQRYPYEVLYENQGICGEKSELLALLLKELGYGTSLFYYVDENHESVGIKCPLQNSVKDTGYCFIETTGASIITHDGIEYAGGLKLESTPEVIIISEGNSLGENIYEYRDAKILKEIDNKIKEKGRINPFDMYRLNKLKEKYQLEEYYDPR